MPRTAVAVLLTLSLSLAQSGAVTVSPTHRPLVLTSSD